MGIVFSFKQMVSNIVSSEYSQDLFAKEFERFIVRLAVIEAVPVLLIAFGILQIFGSFQIIDHPVVEPVVLLIVTLLIMAFGALTLHTAKAVGFLSG